MERTVSTWLDKLGLFELVGQYISAPARDWDGHCVARVGSTWNNRACVHRQTSKRRHPKAMPHAATCPRGPTHDPCTKPVKFTCYCRSPSTGSSEELRGAPHRDRCLLQVGVMPQFDAPVHQPPSEPRVMIKTHQLLQSTREPSRVR